MCCCCYCCLANSSTGSVSCLVRGSLSSYFIIVHDVYTTCNLNLNYHPSASCSARTFFKITISLIFNYYIEIIFYLFKKKNDDDDDVYICNSHHRCLSSYTCVGTSNAPAGRNGQQPPTIPLARTSIHLHARDSKALTPSSL